MAVATERQIFLLDAGGRPLRRTPRAQYDAASHSRRTANWRTRNTGPNTEIAQGLGTLRDRHRDLMRNNPWARRAVQAIVNNTVGAGIVAQWEDPAVQARWSEWFGTTAVDADRRLSGHGLQALILRTIVESGECLIRRRPRRTEDGLPVPLQIQVLEPDYLDDTKTETLSGGGYIVQGVEFNAFGQRVAYWLYPEHPGDPKTWKALQSEQYMASEISHVFRVDRPGQVRGVPWGTGAMLRLKALDNYADAQLERQMLAACYVAFVRETDPQTESAEEYELLSKLEPGAIEILPPGKDMTFASPPQVENDQHFKLGVLQAVAADYGIPYETLTGDLSQVNFSSARMGWNEFSRNIDAWRWELLQPGLFDPLVSWFRDACELSGQPVAQPRPLWTPPARVMVDITREVPALRDAVRSGFLSLPQAIRQQGYDPLTLVREQAAFLRVLDELGVVLESDPRQDKKAAAPADPAEPDQDDAAPPAPEPPPKRGRGRPRKNPDALNFP